MTGSGKVLDLAEIIRAATIPVKVSVLLTEHNFEEVPEIIARCGELGVERMVLRQPYEPAAYSGPSRWEVLADQDPVGNFAGNPVYQLDGVEVTVWDFIATDLGCINLYSDGSINDEYLLARGINDPFGGAGGAL